MENSESSMDIETFLQNFANQLPNPDEETLTPDTDFHRLSGWSSLTALLEMAMIEDEYRVTLTGADIRGARTLQELFNAIQGERVGSPDKGL